MSAAIKISKKIFIITNFKLKAIFNHIFTYITHFGKKNISIKITHLFKFVLVGTKFLRKKQALPHVLKVWHWMRTKLDQSTHPSEMQILHNEK